MTLRGVLDVVLTDPGMARVVAAAGNAELAVTAPPSVQPLVAAALAAAGGESGVPVLVVTAGERDADAVADQLRCFLPDRRTEVFPAWETLPHERLSPRADTVGRRLAVLRDLTHPGVNGTIDVLVAPVRSVLQPLAPGLGDLVPVELRAGDSAELDDVAQALSDAAYTRVELVEKRGEFAVRGGLLDVFPPTEPHPVRVEFWGDEVDELRYFSAADQRSLDERPERLWAPPCRELLLTPEVRARAAELAHQHPGLLEVLGKVAEGIAVEGMESLTPALIGGRHMDLLTDLVPRGTHVLVCDPERVRSRAADLVRTAEEFLAAAWSSAAAGATAAGAGEAPLDLGASSFRDLADVESAARGRGLPWWSTGAFTLAIEDDDTHVALDATTVDRFAGDVPRAIDQLRTWSREGWRLVVTFAGPGPAQRAADQFAEADLGARLVPDIATAPESRLTHVTQGNLEAGFTFPGVGLALLTEHDLTGQRGTSMRDAVKMPARRRNAVDLVQLQPGDLVVHEHHGIGRYIEMVSRTVNGGQRDYLIVEYAPSKRNQPPDRLFVPTDALDQLTRYVGGEAPALSKLGGADWQKTKGQARRAVKQIAAELIRLYSARMATQGHAFGPDTVWQRELEDAFPFHETPDQLAAIDEVKTDMQNPVPMDRIICGDVGYGKTEIAVRAAFKAVQDGKQVAVLVPTTLLANQHFKTFSERFAQFPVKVQVLSRFQSDAETRQILEELARGEVDVLVGTHRLLQPTIRWKDLGLVVVDEEQRFGVEHKEYLKTMRTAVDVLSMSATPIPRTLEMSLTGIREMSTILTPPEERHPVLTYVGAWDDKQMAAAIRRELLRDGQVFVIHNRVQSIDKAAAKIRNLVPEARVAVGHGQMKEHELERIMVGFWEKEYDVLVATTIVESGLDIPNANTLIVDRADTFGLSQLHQIRGRVGRGRERAYAYFTYDPSRPLTETSVDRLTTIAHNTDLGAGMAVAMKDLEIRGSGNLLGGEQSGHIAGVGFDLYVRLVGEAVTDYRAQLSGEEVPAEPAEVRVDLPVDAHLPHDYVPGERLRMEAYRKVASVQSDEQAQAVLDELTDRYGAPPAPVLNLLAVARFRAAVRTWGITEVSMQGRAIRISPVPLRESQQMRLARLADGATYKSTVDTISLKVPVGPDRRTPLRDVALLENLHSLLAAVLEQPVAA
ncbi:transcription-repair coupling factor [Geodermatophilus sabuli]|uniref:Transcription-repair-coupling factor n=1 Tax=Geodermatophilus sabuli TaxID=1564158 RepID=A0A285EGG2_9ACTN|nr:transcription-repair coupling factor [Geodermatophilus sabuli]MBB3083214.1 transcription-repair coupling factor (superfamily II helicase) [Geodermatophilus sabuli]SNX98209.1 transcription-repair coupling factor [Geodermatophilus sabuli]